MNLREYETTFILRPDLAPSAMDAAVDRLRSSVDGSGGKMLEINHWGKKKLAYEIDNLTRGQYVHSVYLGLGQTVLALERSLRLDDNVLRHLTVMLDDNVDPSTRHAKEYVRPEYEQEQEDTVDDRYAGSPNHDASAEREQDSTSDEDETAAASSSPDSEAVQKSSEAAEAADDERSSRNADEAPDSSESKTDEREEN